MRSLPAKSFLVATFALTLGLAGCASGGGGGGEGEGAPRGSANRIVLSEIETVQQLNAYEAIQRLRPAWLRSRSSSDPVIMVDGGRQAGGLDALRSFRAADLEEMRYMSANDASNRFGTGFQGGAILLTTHR